LFSDNITSEDKNMIDEAKPAHVTNVGKWNEWYQNLSVDVEGTYGGVLSYLAAAAFLADVEEVEDWGCGKGGFRQFCLAKYVGIDGSNTPFADKVVDLCTYRSNAPGIVVRHVLEHNYSWERILDAAVISFQKKLCLILFTPFAEETQEIAHNRQFGIDVPDLSFKHEDIEKHFGSLMWKLIPNIKSDTQYGLEHIYFVWRK
jgi:hypothetical protein